MESSFSFVLLSPIIFCNVVAADFSTILTETVFKQIAPSASAPDTYAGFVQAVNNWNANNANNLIFSGSTEMQQRHELAAFFGNTLHESDAFRAPREYFMCQYNTIYNSDLYCELPSTQFDFVYEQYCSTNHQDPATGDYEDGCNCALHQPDNPPGGTYVLANKLCFGRGELYFLFHVRSAYYNYIDASKALTGSSALLCQSPDLVATDPVCKYSCRA